MTKRFGLNVILLLLVVVLAAVVYFEPGQEPLESRMTLLSLTAAQVDKIQLQNADVETIIIERRAHGWMIVAPIRVAANDYRVEQLLKLLSATSYSHFPASARPLAAFGLDEPRAKVTFNEQLVAFGGHEALHQRRYVRVGDQIHLINDYHFYRSQLLLTALVDMTLLPADWDLTQVSFPGLLLQQRQGDWHWQSTSLTAAEREPLPPAMDDINRWLQAWRLARAVRVSRYQAEEPEGQIELQFANGEVMALEILAREPELILGRKALGLRYHFSTEQRRDLLALSPSLSDADQAASTAADITSVAND